jgi:hypothetical protein
VLPKYTHLLRLSQGHLNLLTACPRKFQHTYLEQLTTPTDPQQEEYQTLGSRFHLLMQQQEMGLPINSFLQTDAQLQKWVTSFAKVAPEILAPNTDEETFRESEHYRTLQIQDYLLTVIYDLLITDNQKAQVLDWKTYPQPPNKGILAKSWQTRLYMYVLVETSNYLPGNISMIYWFVQAKGKTKSIRFNYNIQQHQKTEQDLNYILVSLNKWLEGYQKNQPFPQIPAVKKYCESCQYAFRCYSQSSNSVEINSNLLPNIDNIPEISFS